MQGMKGSLSAGKMAMLGYGTAPKMLFLKENCLATLLEWNEIVAFINTIAKFSDSIREVRELTTLYWKSVQPSSVDLVDTLVKLISSLAKQGYMSAEREEELVCLFGPVVSQKRIKRATPILQLKGRRQGEAPPWKIIALVSKRVTLLLLECMLQKEMTTQMRSTFWQGLRKNQRNSPRVASMEGINTMQDGML